MSNQIISSSITRFKAFFLNNPWKARTVIAFSTVILLLVIIRLILTPTIIYGVNDWLKEQDIDSSIEDVKIGLFNGTVSLINAKGSRDNHTVFDIGLVDIHWHWTPLSNKTIKVTEVVFDQIKLNIEKYNDAIIISGINIPLGAETKINNQENENTDTNSDESHWSAALGTVLLKDLKVCYLQHETSLKLATDETRQFDYCVDLQKMAWNGNISYGEDNTLVENESLPISSTGDFTLNGLIVRDNKLNKVLLASKANTLSKVKILGINNIHIAEIDMNDLSALERDDQQHIDTVRFKQFLIKDINLTELNTLSLGNIILSDPGLYLVKNDKENWEHQPWIPKLKKPATTSTQNSVNTEKSSVFTFKVNNISINRPDLCYLEKDTTQYYCFTAQILKWKGIINSNKSLQASGDVSLLQPEIRNHSLERNLLSIQSLNLDQLIVSDLSNIKLDKLSIENLSALQRGDEVSDTTASFSSLLINDIHFSEDKINIDTIDLNDLTSNISINKNGQWEHDKWTPPENQKESIKAETKQKKTRTLQLSLNKLTISTENKNLLTDNSTKPATVAGLEKLSFDLSKINADNPDTDSPFKLFAKTTRHSTIDLEGTFRPFAKKVSMHADGKLKGFDLRAASPAAHKAIGHIIKSGQLDADITLRATDGILDSNIALSLYHFNLKALSKEDAKELDDLFGMPINQSLVLLRDKDDSIHLDIPITGDINNPDFNPMDAIIKATTKATTVTLITFYTPYGLIYAGGNVLFDLATALNFDPVIFEAGSANLTDDNKDSLISLAKLLTEKPQVRLTLCGATNVKDYNALFPDSKLTKEALNSELRLSEDKIIALNELAKKRQVDIKNYLVNKKSIGHERLILCTPEFNSDKDAISGVEINI